MASSSTYSTFAKVITSYHEQYGSTTSSIAGPSKSPLDAAIRYDIVLDEEGGLVRSLMDAVEETIKSRTADDGGGMDEEEQEALLREHRTWQLLRAVYDNRIPRLDEGFIPVKAQDHLAQDPYISPEDLTQLIVNEDDELSLFVTLVEHLQSRPLLTSSPPLEARHGYLPTTLRRVKIHSSSTHSLDPDFTLRDPHGPGLAGEDQTYQTPLLATLWDLIRHGELDRAVTVCEQGGEPWRGASLMGGRRWGMGGMTKDSIPGPMEGNRMRALWKRACRAIAQNPLLSAGERRVYAALISDLPTLLPACETWEDHLWAHVQAGMESRLERRLDELGGFWNSEDGLLGRDEVMQNVTGSLNVVFEGIAGVQNEKVMSANRDPYYVAQRAIILGQTDMLFIQFASRIPELDEMMAPELVGPLLRFFAHLVLILRNLSQPVPDASANSILQAYLRVLEREGSDGLVAMYAACLREGSGEESYAQFLRSMDPNATRAQKMEALGRARTHNLDVTVIARETVRLILEEAFATIPSLSGELPNILSFSVGLSERDVQIIRAIEWLTMMPETAEEALVQSNAVGRYFLALGQASAAQSLLRTLPKGIAGQGDENNGGHHGTEHECFVQLFAVFACYELVEEVLSRTPKATATKMEQHNWRKSLASVIEKTRTATIELLTSDWLRISISSRTDPTAPQRRKELRRIRQTFIPDLVLRLHTLLFTHRKSYPHLLQQALDLTKIVADEDNHCYEEFFGRGGEGDDPFRLIAYLERVREAGMAALEAGSGSAFVGA